MRSLRRGLGFRGSEGWLLLVDLGGEGLVNVLGAADVEESASGVFVPVAQVRDVRS